MNQKLSKRLVAEFVGTAMLLAAVVGSGIMGERLAAGNIALALLANSIATGTVLGALIFTFGPISGAHLNPAVTSATAVQKEMKWLDAAVYVGAQILGAFLGVVLAHVMFAERIFSASTHVRVGAAQTAAEFVATFGLLAVVRGCVRSRPSVIPFALGAYITGAYWFTASTSFANPAVSLARTLTATFAGIRPVDAPAFIAAQITGAFAATALIAWLTSRDAKENVHD